MTDPHEKRGLASRRHASAPSVHSSIRAQAMTGAVPDFKSDVKRPTGCRVLLGLALLGAPVLGRGAAPRAANSMKGPAGGTCSTTRCSRAAATLRVVATGPHTADIGHGLLREARLGRDHHHADVEHDAFAEAIGRAPDHGLSSST